LRTQGILPPEFGLTAETRRARQIYVGNLSEKFTVQILRDLFEPACRKLPEFNSSLSAAVVNVEMHDRFAFVELQNEAMAGSVLGLFNNVDVLGRRIFVGRAQPGLGVTNAAKIGALLAAGPAGAATVAALTAAYAIINNK
jgi:RNA recognition motif-containing protein